MANEKLVNRENLKAFREKYDKRLTSGQVIPSKSLTANEINAISDESGDTQETPFILQGTGTANGSSSVDTGTVGKHIQKQGSVYCVNQLVQNGNFASNTNWSISGVNDSYSIANNKATLTLSADSNRFYQNNIVTIPNHKYLVFFEAKSSVNLIYVAIELSRGYVYLRDSLTANVKKRIGGIITPTSATDTANLVNIYTRNDNYPLTLEVSDVQLIDLTQWFNGNIPQDLLDHPEHWSWYQNYGNYIAYNTGTLVDSNGQFLECGGRNLFDISTMMINATKQGDYYVGEYALQPRIGFDISSFVGLLKPFNIRIIAKQNGSGGGTPFLDIVYTDGTSDRNEIARTTSDTVLNIHSDVNKIVSRLSITYGTNPNNTKLMVKDVCISLYYAGEDYSQHYPYEQPKVYDTGSEQLLSTGVKLSVSGEREDIYDYKEPSGLITRRVGSYTFTGNETWYVNGATGSWKVFPLNYALAKNVGASTKPNAILIGYLPDTENHIFGAYGEVGDFGFCVFGNQISIRNTSIASTTAMANAMAGKTLYYELATPTTEQGTPFSENIEINDFGTMGWKDNTDYVSVPQGCKIFYPAWYVGFIDALGKRADIDWNANNVVSQIELSNATTPIVNRIPPLPSDSDDGTYTLKATKSGDTITYSWVVDE